MGPVLFLILAAVFIGALTQRVTGMGFALVAGPFLVLLLDPLSGVVLINLIGMASSSIVFSRTFREVDWRKVAVVAVTAAAGSFPGALLASRMSPSHLQILIGVLIIVSLAASLLLNRRNTFLRQSVRGQGATGLVAGVMGSAAGVPGPALSVYAVLTRWPQREFAACMQPILLFMGVFAVGSKLLFDPAAWPSLEPIAWILILAALVVGQVAGEWLSKVLPISVARAAMIALAMLGGVATLVKGLGWMA